MLARIKCWLGGLLAAWVVQIFGTSALVALIYHSDTGVLAFWEVADEVAPFAKISFVLFLALLVTPLRQRQLTWPTHLAWWTVASATALLLVLALLPLHLSRGFGIGLTGYRFDWSVLPIYWGGAMIAGLSGAVLELRCRLTGTAVR